MNTLSRFFSMRGLYRYADLGARAVLAAHAGVAQPECERIGIAHGVDAGQLAEPQDINLVHPIHWAFNPEILERAKSYKPCLALPHPYLMIDHKIPSQRGRTIVVGPPPGERNDRRLLEALRTSGFDDFDILLKARGDVARSLAFWAAHGVTVRTAGARDHAFYHRLAGILDDYAVVVGCSLSSALVFAGATGARVRILPVVLEYYEPASAERLFVYDGAFRNLARAALNGDDETIRALSEHLLGAAFDRSRDHAREAIEEANRVADRRPLYGARGAPYSNLARTIAASAVGRPAILANRMGLADVLARLHGQSIKSVAHITINELDVAMNGQTEDNLRYDIMRYVPGKTEPGMGL